MILTYTISTDKAGGKKFSKDFEEGSAQIQEFIKFLSNHCKAGLPLMQSLTNADIFYEMQYKEVKIVANVSDKYRLSERFCTGVNVVYTMQWLSDYDAVCVLSGSI